MKEKESNEEPEKEDGEEDSELYQIRLQRKEKEKRRRLTAAEKEQFKEDYKVWRDEREKRRAVEARRKAARADYDGLNYNTIIKNIYEEEAKWKRKREVPDPKAELFDSVGVLKLKVGELFRMMKKAKYTVVFTGAGISTSAGIADYNSGAHTNNKTGAGC